MLCRFKVQALLLTTLSRPDAPLVPSLRHELDRCKEAVLRLALPRPGITFTLYDCSKRAFLLKMIAVRCSAGAGAGVVGARTGAA